MPGAHRIVGPAGPYYSPRICPIELFTHRGATLNSRKKDANLFLGIERDSKYKWKHSSWVVLC